MALYPGQSQLSLPRTPDACTHNFNMNSAASALPSMRPADFFPWSNWRSSPTKHPQDSSTSTPLTPPMTSTFQSRTAYASSFGQAQPPLPAPSIPEAMQMDEESEEEDEVEDSYEQAPAQPGDEGRMTLPPIAHLERHLHHLHPLTPPNDFANQVSSRIALPKIATTESDANFFQQTKQTVAPMLQYEADLTIDEPPRASTSIFYEPSHRAPPSSAQHQPSATSPDASELHGITPNTSAAAATTITTLALAPAPPAYLVDWLDFTRTRSAHFIAEKTCEMICYLWFSIPSHAKSLSPCDTDSSPTPDPSILPKSTMTSVTALQLVATPAFVSFMQKLLETTQVSQSVIVLSLHYIHRLKEKNRYMPAQPGSEFRIAVAGLMMANKFLDDNTYTNKTWSEVSGISLDEINRMESEFLLGVDFNLYVDKTTYASWLNLLKGLVLAKERDARKLLRGGMAHGSRGAHSARRTAAAVAVPSFRPGRDRDGKSWHPHHNFNNHHQSTAPHDSTSHAHPSVAPPATTGPASRVYTSTAAASNAIHANIPSSLYARPYRHRARSTSPHTFTFSSTNSIGPRVVSHSTSGGSQYAEGATRPVLSSHSQEHSAYMDHFYQTSVKESHLLAPPSPQPGAMPIQAGPAITSGVKRSAEDAFLSPTVPGALPPFQPAHPSKRSNAYASLHSLQIPDFDLNASSGTRPSSGSNSASIGNPSPLESLHGFERMSLGVIPGDNVDVERGRERSRRRERTLERDQRSHDLEDHRHSKRVKADSRATTAFSNTSTMVPQTLVAAYSADDATRVVPPRNLFFYTLASSPNADEKQRERERQASRREQSVDPSETSMESDDVPYAYSDSKARKTRLRYQAAQPIKHGYDYADLNSFAVRGAPLYSYPTSTMASRVPEHQSNPPVSAISTATPISPVPALVPARLSAPSVSYISPPYTSTQSSGVHTSTPAQPSRISHAQSVRLPATAAHSASNSPAVAGNAVLQHLPRFHDDVWAAPPLPASDQALGPGPASWYPDHQPRQADRVMEYSESPGVSPTAKLNTSPSRHLASTKPPSSLPGSANSSPFHRHVPSAHFANAGPPGVVTQFYSTPEVQQVHMPVQMPATYGAYAPYPTYGTPLSSGLNSLARVVTGGTPAPEGFVQSGSQRHQSTTGAVAGNNPSQTAYTYSGAHSTSNSPYHSAASGLSRYGDYAYSAHPGSRSPAYSRF